MNTDDNIPLAELPANPTLADYEPIFKGLHSKVSDIFIQPDRPITVRYKGRIVQASKGLQSEKAVGTLIEDMAGATLKAEIEKGLPQSWSYNIQDNGEIGTGEQTVSLRYRCNAKSVQTYRSMSQLSVVMRPIPQLPMRLEKLGLPQRLVNGLFPDSGIVLFSGPTGSGKTTTLAAVLQEICYDPLGKIIVTIEEPVEYNLHALTNTTCYLTHCEVGRNVRNFPLTMRAALRENPDVIMTGEMRDEESMLIAVEASQTGHAVYSTLHTNSVTSVFVRVAQKMPPERAEAVISTFIEASRTFVYQRLFPSVKGGVVCIIEYIILTPQDRVRLLGGLATGGIASVTKIMTELMAHSGKWYHESAKEAFEAGHLSEESYNSIVIAHKLETQMEHANG